MDHIDRKKLRKNRTFLISDLIVSQKLLSLLFENDILTPEMKEEIENNKTSATKVTCLIDILPRRGNDAYQQFLRALVLDNQQSIVAQLQGIPLEEVDANPVKFQPVEPLYCTVTDEEIKENVLSEPAVFTFNGFNKFSPALTTTGMYTMSASRRGRALVFNNEHFTKFDQRQGTKHDAENLKTLLIGLRFDVDIYDNKSSEEILNQLELERIRDHSAFNALIVVFLSHGHEGCVYGNDSKQVTVEQIHNYFRSDNCRSLGGKPKVFIFQACQDSPASTDHSVVTSWSTAVAYNNSTDTVDASPEVGENPFAHFYTAFATVKGFTASRRIDLGTYFIRAFVYLMWKRCHDTHLEDIMTQVSRVVGDMPNNGYSQLPERRTTLKRSLYLYP